MPELPEVETTIRGLKKQVLNRTFIDVWTNFPKIIKKPTSFLDFRANLKGKRIQEIHRAGKNVIFQLSGEFSLLVHQKMTGHLLYGKWSQKEGQWAAEIPGPLKDDPMNRFLHLIFFLDNGFQIALADARKFAKVELWDSSELENSKTIKELGPDALSSFTFNRLQKAFQKKRGKIKQVLMDQKTVAGIGNIYSDEILFAAGVSSLKKTNQLTPLEMKRLHAATKEVLRKAVDMRGTSVSDYRSPDGQKGDFMSYLKVYRRQGKKCFDCGSLIKRIKLGGRSAHFCPRCQKG